MASQEGISQDQTVSAYLDERLKTVSIPETLQRLAECSKFFEFLEHNQLTQSLGHSGLHTLFAPNNEAFESTPSGDADQLVNAHLARGALLAADIRRAKQVRTESGKTLDVEERDGTLRIGPAALVKPDIACTNGVIQIVDEFLSEHP